MSTTNTAPSGAVRRYQSFKEFYPFYASQHQQFGTRLLHVIGTTLFLANSALCLAQRTPARLLLGPVLAYGCAWIGHFFVECNKPATFKYPLWSLVADFVMFGNILVGREALRVTAKQA